MCFALCVDWWLVLLCDSVCDNILLIRCMSSFSCAVFFQKSANALEHLLWTQGYTSISYFSHASQSCGIMKETNCFYSIFLDVIITPENPGIGLAKIHSVYRSFIINHDFELWGCFDLTHVFFSLIDVASSLLPENGLVASF